ncbi:MAG: helix-turn-helix transcriptional regulator [Bacteroidota bacterium]
MGIGSKLENLLELRGRNVNDVALAINVKPPTLYSIIKRDSNHVDIELVFKLADELGVKVDYFTERSRSADESIEDVLANNSTFEKEIKIMKERPGLHTLVLSSGEISDKNVADAFKIIKALKK